VVIIARNEAGSIALALESVLTAVSGDPATDVVLVDSASTDGTVAIAAEFPIRIVRMRPDWPLSAAAGRVVGTRVTSGEFIQFLDGDMTLEPRWLEAALPYLAERPALAGVSGWWRDFWTIGGRVVVGEDQQREARERLVPWLPGAALYRRSALERVGGFNPYLVSNEEADLGLRLRHAGFLLSLLPFQIASHRTLPQNSAGYWWRRARNRALHGRGQLLREHWGTPLFRQAAAEHAGDFAAFAAALLAAAVLAAFSLLLRSPLPLLAGAVMAAGLFVAVVVRKGGVRAALLSVLGRALLAYGTFRGLFSRPRRSTDYPTDVEVVREARQRSASG
jgi:glycosyltransferase involved in cell wall biosynthesis